MPRYQEIRKHLIAFLFLFSYRYFIETDLSHDENYALVQMNQMHVVEPITFNITSTTLPIDNNPDSTSTLPTFIIHPGPHKTGTTSIQNTLWETQSILHRDNYYIPGPNPLDATFAFTMKKNLRLQNKDVLPEFKTFFEEAKSDNKNVILSGEEFNDVDPSLLQAFIGPGFHYRIVIMYRRYYEWIFSVYNQTHKRKTRSFEDIQTFLKTKPIRKPFHSGEVFDSYKEVFDDVALLNYHNEKSISESFFCEGVTNADLICQRVKETPEEHRNEAVQVEGQRVTYAAVKYNIISSDTDLMNIFDKVTERVEEELQKENNPLTSCVEDHVMEELFQLTMDTEKRLLPEWYEEQRLRESFDEFRKNRLKVCYMNLDAMFEDIEWMNFLKNL